MNRWALGVLGILTVALLAGCGKKDNEASLETLNGVDTGNVVSVTDPAATDAQAVPVIVDNAMGNVTTTMGELAAVAPEAAAVVTDKPTSKQIQQALKNAGFYEGKVDGDIGPKTKKAVEAFQAQNGLKADGKVGPKTWAALLKHLNTPTEVANPTAKEQTLD